MRMASRQSALVPVLDTILRKRLTLIVPKKIRLVIGHGAGHHKQSENCPAREVMVSLHIGLGDEEVFGDLDLPCARSISVSTNTESEKHGV